MLPLRGRYLRVVLLALFQLRRRKNFAALVILVTTPGFDFFSKQVPTRNTQDKEMINDRVFVTALPHVLQNASRYGTGLGSEVFRVGRNFIGRG